MPEVPGGPPGHGSAERRTAESVPDGHRAVHGPDHGPRSPGWRDVLLVAALVLGTVLALEILSSLLPPVREAFRALPVTIVALVVGTVGLLLVIAIRRPGH